ncbi:MAG: type II toxin-antitoxin system HicA family toxin [Candidatus Altiarchaeota archaeon]|nr:type II toxin-antitoxin system HicA family toxin [Candidatus Altiarchaeota archaeon]
MRRIPLLSGKDVIKALKKLGYEVVRQRGSHVRLRHPTRPPATVPAVDDISIGTIMNIIKQAELSVEEFLELLD